MTLPQPGPPAATAAPGVAARFKWLLIGSLAVNLLIVGAAVGLFATHRRPHDGRDLNIGRFVASDQGLPGFVHTLPPERRSILGATAGGTRQTLRPLRQAVRTARHEASSALAADPFDPARFQAAMEALNTAENAARRAGVTILSSAIALMTPAERAQFQSWRRRFDSLGPAPPERPEAAPAPK